MRVLGSLLCVALLSIAAGCTDAIPESAYATPPSQFAEALPSCSSVAVSPAYWAVLANDVSPTGTAAEARYIVLEGDEPVCETTFAGLELLAERVGETNTSHWGPHGKGLPVEQPESNPMPGAPAAPASNPMPGAPVAAPASNPMPGAVPVSAHSMRLFITQR